LRFGVLLSALGLLLLLLPSAARAGREFEVTPSAGFRFGGTLSESTTGDVLTVGESAGFGLTLGLRESPRTLYELVYRFQRTDLIGEEGTGEAPPRTDMDIHCLQIGSAYEFDQARIRPFISAGLGLTTLVPGGAGEDSSTNFSLSLGGGVKIPFTERTGLRLEGRGYLTLLESGTEIFCISSGGVSCAVGVQGDFFGQFEVQAGIYVLL